jgi:PAS domain S-box-containing protein
MSRQTLPLGRSLKRKLLLPMLLLWAVLAAAAGWSIYAQFQNQMVERVRMRAEMVANAVNYAAESVSNHGELQRIVTAIGAEDEVSLIVVVGSRPARVLASTRGAWLGKALGELPGAGLAEDLRKVIQSRQSYGHLHRETAEFGFVTPLLLSRADLVDRSLSDGAVMVLLDMRVIRAAMRRLTVEFTAAFLVVLVLLATLGYALVHRIVLLPVFRIGKLVEQCREGTGEGWAAVATDDEIGALARTLQDSLTRTAAARRELEEQKGVLHDAEARYRLLFEQSPDGIVILDTETARPLEFNETAHRQLGYSRAEFARLSIADIEVAGTPEETAARIARVQREGRNDFDTRQRTRQGEVRDVHVTAQIVEILGRPVYHCIWRDITERKRAEAEKERLQARLERAQKMESIGRLAGGVAHDFNNLLMGIMNYVELCRDGLPADHPVRAYLDEITQDAQRSADVARQLLAFARKQTIAPRLLDLNDALIGVLKTLRRLLGADIDLAWRPGAAIQRVRMDPSQLDQILTDLTANAREAIRGVGKLTIETRNATIDLAYCAEHPDAVPGEYVMLAVSDSGCGMSKETIEHLFEPFFTTKELARGAGLGLATVYGIVRQNNGFISVSSKPGEGTTLRVYLPAEGAPASPAAPASARSGGTETILLVEDEKSVRVTTRLFLEAMGYTVLPAADPEEALRLAAAHAGGVHLLLADVVMPGLSGPDLARRLTDQWPALKCLFMSGYTADALSSHAILRADLQLLAKPFTRDCLARKVREVLAG